MAQEFTREDYEDARMCRNCAHSTIAPFGHTYGYMCMLDNKRCCKTKVCANHIFEGEDELDDWESELDDLESEPHYRPFENSDEVMEAIEEHGGYVKQGAVHFAILQITDFFVRVVSGDEIIEVKFPAAFNAFTFADGTPFGVKED